MDELKILVVEDDLGVVDMIRRGLQQEGYKVTVAMDGKTGLAMATDYQFDLVTLDLMLPGLSGMEVCQAVRKIKPELPILMLTALDSPENIVQGLDGGADDYLIKPFNFEVLIARIRNLMKRKGGLALAHDTIKIANLTINISAKTVKRDELLIDLTATEFRLLEYLAKNRERVLSRVDILENVWDINFNMGTNVVDVYINYLRKKIDKDFSPQLIKTSFGMGYVLKE